MKIAIVILCVFLCTVCIPIANAEDRIDVEGSSVTLYYQIDAAGIPSQTVQCYQIAHLAPDSSYVLTDQFAPYPVVINGLLSIEEQNDLSSTLSGYITADQLLITNQKTTDDNGMVRFDDLTPGLYLIRAVEVQNGNSLVTFHDFLLSLPTANSDSEESRTISIYPKYSTVIPKPDIVEFQVIKTWKDNGYQQQRPQTVTIDLYHNGLLYETQELSEQNNWMYRWQAPNNGGTWTVVERNIAEHYTVTSTRHSNTFIITNTYDRIDESHPQTGDQTIVWPYALIMCISGGILIITAIRQKGKQT